MKRVSIYIWLVALGMCLPLQAQIENTETVTDDEWSAADSIEVDSVAADSLSLPWPQALQRRIDGLLQADMFGTSQVALLVYDLTADSTLYAHNERQLMRPASTMKLVTAIAALDRLGGNYQLKTSVCYTGKIENRTLSGDVYCVGGFDPCFDSDDMKAFVDCMRALQIDTIRGNLYADKHMKELDTMGEGWCWDDDNPVLSPLLYRRKDRFMEQFEKELRAAGIVVEAFSSSAQAPADAVPICERTHTIDQVLLRMMKQSDNLYAEALFYQRGTAQQRRPITAKDVREEVRRLIRKVGLNAAGYRIADGSGLSLYNYISAELLVRLLRYAYTDEHIYRHLHPSLPVAGIDGTLRDRMRGSTTRTKVQAKTGTVTGVSSLAGYCEAANGHVLCFAVINQGLMHGKNGRNFQNKLCEAMCRP